MDLALIYQHADKFLMGAGVTLGLTLLSLSVGLLIALPCALVRARRLPVLDPLVRVYLFIFRGSPLFVQAYLVYYGFFQLDLVRHTFLWVFFRDAWFCVLFVFSLNTGAYTTEILRGGLINVKKGELEAAKALGLSAWKRLVFIEYPMAIRHALPQYGNEVVFMLHGTAVVSYFTITDVLGAGRWLNSRYNLYLEGFVTAALVYILFTYAFIWAFRFIEKRYLGYLKLSH